jgi:hypothetical protein
MLDEEGLETSMDILSPLPEGTTKDERRNYQPAHIDRLFEHLRDECEELLPYYRIGFTTGYRDRQPYTILGLAATLHPHQKYIPGEKTMEKLKVIMQDIGFKGDPDWFPMSRR